MAAKNNVFGVLLVLASACYASVEDVGRIEEEGYYKREHSLVQPYHGEGYKLKSCYLTIL